MQSEKKYTRLIYLVICLIVSTSSHAQSFEWAKQMGGSEWDEGRVIATDNLGNVYIAGEFKDTAYFDPGVSNTSLIAGGNRDIFISKLDAFGNLLWTKQIGGSQTTSREHVNAIVLDGQGNIYITGNFAGITDFDPGPNTFYVTSLGVGVHTAFVCKLDQLGNFIWAKQFGSVLASASNSIAVDQYGNAYTTGYFDGTADFDPDPVSIFNLSAVEYSDVFISKLDSAGNFVWAKQFGGIQGAVGYAIALDENANVYSTGTIGGTVDFDPGPGTFNIAPSTTPSEFYISKLDSLGDFVWAQPIGPGQGRAIAVDQSNNVYTSGWAPVGYTPAINKHDPLGNVLWSKQLVGSIGNYISLDNSGNVYTIGECSGTNDFDPGPGVFNLNAGSSDSYIIKLDTSGVFVWAGVLESTDQVWAKSMAVDANDNLYTTGYFDGTADFDPDTTTSFELITQPINYDVFVLKLSPSFSVAVSENNFEEKITIYPNPTEGSITVDLGGEHEIVNLVLRNSMGQVVKTETAIQGNCIELLIDGASGVYLLEIADQKGHRAVTRIIKNEPFNR